jgi:hypothetical protein
VNNSRLPLLTVMGAPATTPHAPTTMTVAHHAPANRAREISFNIACVLFRVWRWSRLAMIRPEAADLAVHN